MEEIKQIVTKILNFFDAKNLEIEINDEKETLRIILKMDGAGFLIGKDGLNLKDLEYILQAVLKNKCGLEKKLFLDINNYRYGQEEKLKDSAKEAAQKVLTTKRPVRLHGFNAYERRIIHMELSTNPNLITESEGEGENRCLVVRPYP